MKEKIITRKLFYLVFNLNFTLKFAFNVFFFLNYSSLRLLILISAMAMIASIKKKKKRR